MSHVPYTSTVPGSRANSPSRSMTLLAAVWSALVRWHRRRLAVRRLATLNDHMLKDIGISRSEIGSIVRTGRGNDRRREVDFGRSDFGPLG